jgi:hypothetical protein
MFVGDLFNYQAARLSFPPKSADSHATVRETELDGVFESQWFVRMNVIVCGGYGNSHCCLSGDPPRAMRARL